MKMIKVLCDSEMDEIDKKVVVLKVNDKRLREKVREAERE